MKTDWKKVKLGEIATFSNGVNFGKESYTSGVKLIGVSNFGNKYFPEYEELDEINEKVLRENDYLKDGDIVFVRSNGNKELVGRCMLIQNPPSPVTYSGFCIRARLNDTATNNPRFFAYYFKSKIFRKSMSNSAVGANIQNLNQGLLSNHEISLPPLETQQKIAHILSRYDEAIENNNKRIKLLEQMAQNLYKEWFVRFRFPRYENCEFENGIPVGWHQGRLSELLEFKRGKNITADEMEDGDVPVISAGLEPSGYHSTSNVQGVSLTISSSGANAGYLAIHYEDIWAADCMFITEKNTKNIYYLYELLNNIRPVIFNQQRGAAQPHVYSKDINNLRLWIPNEELIENANKLFESFHKEIYQLQRANKNLAKQRDLLLPRLMSGKVEVE